VTAGSVRAAPRATETSPTSAAYVQASALIRSNGVSTDRTRGSRLSTVQTVTPPGSGSYSYAGAGTGVTAPSAVNRPRSRRSGVNRHSSSRPVSAGKSRTSYDRSACDLVFGGAIVGMLMLSYSRLTRGTRGGER